MKLHNCTDFKCIDTHTKFNSGKIRVPKNEKCVGPGSATVWRKKAGEFSRLIYLVLGKKLVKKSWCTMWTSGIFDPIHLLFGGAPVTANFAISIIDNQNKKKKDRPKHRWVCWNDSILLLHFNGSSMEEILSINSHHTALLNFPAKELSSSPQYGQGQF